MSDELASRTVLLTGASGGIGRTTAVTLGARGATVLAHHRDSGASVRAAMAGLPDERVVLLRRDLSTAADARALWAAANAEHDVDVLVLNAATMPLTPADGPDDVWDDGWSLALQVNVIATGALLREAARTFVERGSGTVIVLSSWAAEMGARVVDFSGYAASKAAIRNLAQTFARNFADAGLRVYVVAPGVVDAGMGRQGQDAESLKAIAGGLAMGRQVEASEVARLIAFLAEESCPSLTGSTLDVNGASYIR